MPKPSRRERRLNPGKAAPRPSTTRPHGASMEPMERVSAPAAAPAPRAAAPVQSLSNEPGQYAHVKADLIRIAVLAGALIAGMVALRFVLPQ